MKKIVLVLLCIFFLAPVEIAFGDGYSHAVSKPFNFRDLIEQGLDRIPDEPLEYSVSSKRVLDIDFLVRHRSEFEKKEVFVRGFIVDMLVGEDACPPCETDGDFVMPCAESCAQPRIIIADSIEITNPIFRLIILLRDKDSDYFFGQEVTVRGKIHIGHGALYLEKIY